MNLYSTRCLVLKNTAHAESDILVTMFSEDLGKITAIAKGAKRSKKRFVNKLELFSKIGIQYKLSRGSTLLFLAEAELENAYLTLRQNPSYYISAAYLTELIIKFTKERDQDTNIFHLLEWAYSSLHRGDNHLRTAALFHIKLLTFTGYQPEINCCSNCLQPIHSKVTYMLLSGNGALICSRCSGSRYENNRTISVQTLKFMEKATTLDRNRMTRLLLPDYVAKEILTILYQYTHHILQQDVHSWKIFTKDFTKKL